MTVFFTTSLVWLWCLGPQHLVHGFSSSGPTRRVDSPLLPRAGGLDTAIEEPLSDRTEALSRRLWLGGTAAAAAVSTLGATLSGTPLTVPQSMTPRSVSDVVSWIETYCDRRLWHAVVASDYSFLYRGATGVTVPRFVTEPPDLLDPTTYNAPDATQFFVQLQEVLREEAVRPSNGHLATTSSVDAAAWGNSVVSIWPTRDAHYAWWTHGGLFYPRPVHTATTNQLIRNDIVVDGRDCGQDSLEDALQMPSCEILVATREFLAVPLAMQDDLKRALQASFLL